MKKLLGILFLNIWASFALVPVLMAQEASGPAVVLQAPPASSAPQDVAAPEVSTATVEPAPMAPTGDVSVVVTTEAPAEAPAAPPAEMPSTPPAEAPAIPLAEMPSTPPAEAPEVAPAESHYVAPTAAPVHEEEEKEEEGAPIEDKPITAADVLEDEAAAEDVLSDDERGFRGNWVKKNEWLMRAQKRNKKVQALVQEVDAACTKLQESFYQIDDQFDEFFKELGIGQEKVDALFKSIEGYLAKKEATEIGELAARERAGDELSKAEEETLLKARQETIAFKKEYDLFKEDLKAVAKLNSTLQENIKKPAEHLKTVLAKAQHATEKVDEIWQIVDDAKAEANYYEIKNSWKDIKTILDYLNQDFKPHFDAAIQTARETMSAVKKRIADLEAKGLIVKDRAKQLEEIKGKIEKRTEEEELHKQEEQERAKKMAALRARPWYQQWYDSSLSALSRAWSAAGRWVAGLPGRFWGGKESVAPKVAEQTPAPKVEGPAAVSKPEVSAVAPKVASPAPTPKIEAPVLKTPVPAPAPQTTQPAPTPKIEAPAPVPKVPVPAPAPTPKVEAPAPVPKVAEPVPPLPEGLPPAPVPKVVAPEQAAPVATPPAPPAVPK